ncbi:MAG: hypothetical protein CM1200mP40_09900 [Gammaproteobacteria bacterium]|nr:MAG: hypothetical protein CM1200mP40_09900 [Gammaproteobacteria bacterium]
MKQWYDNTADNPNNPDPDQWVFGGSRTADEMTHAWIAITHLDDEGYEELLVERKEKEHVLWQETISKTRNPNLASNGSLISLR